MSHTGIIDAVQPDHNAEGNMTYEETRNTIIRDLKGTQENILEAATISSHRSYDYSSYADYVEQCGENGEYEEFWHASFRWENYFSSSPDTGESIRGEASKYLEFMGQGQRNIVQIAAAAIEEAMIELRELGGLVLGFKDGFNEEEPVSKVITETMDWICTATTESDAWERQGKIPWEWLFRSLRIVSLWKKVPIAEKRNAGNKPIVTSPNSISNEESRRVNGVAKQPSNQASIPGHQKNLSRSRQQAWDAYNAAIEINPLVANMPVREAFEWLMRSVIRDEYQLPEKASAFEAYVNHARRHHGKRKNMPRRGREGRSIVRFKDI